MFSTCAVPWDRRGAGNGENSKSSGPRRPNLTRRHGVSGFSPCLFELAIRRHCFGVDAQALTKKLIGEGKIKRVVSFLKNGEESSCARPTPSPGGLGAALAFLALVNGAQQPRSGYSIKKKNNQYVRFDLAPDYYGFDLQGKVVPRSWTLFCGVGRTGHDVLQHRAKRS